MLGGYVQYTPNALPDPDLERQLYFEACFEESKADVTPGSNG